MANHRYRVRRNTKDGPQVVAFMDSIGKATALATQRMRETGNLFRVERRVGTNWETAQELVPDTKTAIEAAIARGHMPKVQDANGRKGQVLSYVRPTRAVRVAWLDTEQPGKGEVAAVDDLQPR